MLVQPVKRTARADLKGNKMRFNVFSLNRFCEFDSVFDDVAEKILPDECLNVIMVQEFRRLNDIKFRNTYNGKAYKALFDSTELAVHDRNSVGIYAQEDIFDKFKGSALGTMKIPSKSYDDYGKEFDVVNKGILLNVPIGDTNVTFMSLHSAMPYQHTADELTFIVNELSKYGGHWMFIAEFDTETSENILGGDLGSQLGFVADRIAQSDHYCVSSADMRKFTKIYPLPFDDSLDGDSACTIRINIPADSSIHNAADSGKDEQEEIV